MRIAEFGGADPLLLLLDAPADFQCQTNRPFQVLVAHGLVLRRIEQLQESADRLVGPVQVTPGQGAAKEDAVLQARQSALITQLREAFGKKIADQPEVLSENGRLELRNVPARQVAMDAVHERRVVAHLRRQRLKQVAHALLMLHIDLEIADHDDRTVGADALLAARELAGLHVPLHDVHAVLLVEGDAGHLVEAHHVVLAHQASLAIGVVDEHPRHRCLATGDQVRIRRHLLKQMRFASPPRPDLDHVVIALDERDHAQEHRILVALGQFARFETDGT
ncbi:MAG: hypothetical protein AW07_03058 [Candidatus Accumulibacter sp. SK-11]|nr:MAG: hypothetical protein AW07_03058 [Candidatus Accumulibacter sp. SK-11]